MHPCTYTYTMHAHTLTDIYIYIPTALPSIQTQSKPLPGPWTYLFIIDESFVFFPCDLELVPCVWRRMFLPYPFTSPGAPLHHLDVQVIPEFWRMFCGSH